MKKIKKIAIFIFVVGFLAVSITLVIKSSENVLCTGVELRIKDTMPNSVIQSNEIKKYVNKEKTSLIGLPLDNIDLVVIEQKINKFPAIKKAEVYKTIGGKIVFEIYQRMPIMRVINASGENFYVDYEGYLMPLTDNFTSRVIVVNGNIKAGFNRKDTTSLAYLGENASQKLKKLRDIYILAKFIFTNRFWKAQIEQIYLNNEGDLELLPKVGSHTIIFGNIDDYEWKFIKLRSFYNQGLRISGWNTYKTLNLKYGNQVVCTRN